MMLRVEGDALSFTNPKMFSRKLISMLRIIRFIRRLRLRARTYSMAARILKRKFLSSGSRIISEDVLYVEIFRKKLCFWFYWQMLLFYLFLCRWWLMNMNMSFCIQFWMRKNIISYAFELQYHLQLEISTPFFVF